MVRKTLNWGPSHLEKDLTPWLVPSEHQASAEFGSTIRLQVADEQLPRKGAKPALPTLSFPRMMFRPGANQWEMHDYRR